LGVDQARFFFARFAVANKFHREILFCTRQCWLWMPLHIMLSDFGRF
jgi:hypothetical protein